MVDVDGGRRGRMTTLRGSTAGAAHTKRRLSATGQQGESCYIVQETNSSGRPRGQLVTAAVRTQARCHGSAATTGDARFAHGTRQIELSFARVRPSGTSTGAGHSGRWYSGWRTRYTDGEGTGVEQARGQEERRVRRTVGGEREEGKREGQDAAGQQGRGQTRGQEKAGGRRASQNGLVSAGCHLACCVAGRACLEAVCGQGDQRCGRCGQARFPERAREPLGRVEAARRPVAPARSAHAVPACPAVASNAATANRQDARSLFPSATRWPTRPAANSIRCWA